MESNIPINILVVDDHPENLLALEAVLSSDKYNLIKASSGENALINLLKHDIALILLDVQMPGMDGFETARLIKEREKSKDIPIIFITAINKEPEHVFTGYSVGAIDYMFKPFDAHTLRGKVGAFADMFVKQRQLEFQSEFMRKQTEELEKAYKELSATSIELQKAEALSRVIFETSTDTMITLDPKGVILTVNPAVEQMFGYNQTHLYGDSIQKLVPSLLTVLNEAELSKTGLLDTDVLSEVVAFRANGSSFPAEIQFGKTYVVDQFIVACTIRDITERKERLAELQYKAFHDELTELPNRSLLFHRMSQLATDSRPENRVFTLMILDLDHFKNINDTLGHHVGDQLLQQIAERLLAIVDDEDLVIRLGGDEFAIMVPNKSVNEVMPLIHRVMGCFKRSFTLLGHARSIEPSIGIVGFPQHGQSIDVLMRRADMAMYVAKHGRAGYVIFSEDHEQQMIDQSVLMEALKEAIHDDGFALVYQPKITMTTRDIHSVEVLLRWKHPTLGFVPPDKFIPLAEQMGLIESLSKWVLKTAFAQCQMWKRDGVHVTISVNLSARDLLDLQLPERIKDILEEYCISPNQLILEITESSIMEDPKQAMDSLTTLAEMGIRVSIDDFGTGYSSLAYLKNLPVHELKIDQSFVMNMLANPKDKIIVKSIIDLAHTLGLTVVAEGVEDGGVWNELESFGCDTAQGYYISRPLPSVDLCEFIASSKNKDW